MNYTVEERMDVHLGKCKYHEESRLLEVSRAVRFGDKTNSQNILDVSVPRTVYHNRSCIL